MAHCLGYIVSLACTLFLVWFAGTMSGGGKTVCKGRMGSSAVSDVDTKDLANNETKLRKVTKVYIVAVSFELRHEKTNVLHMRKQRRRSASR